MIRKTLCTISLVLIAVVFLLFYGCSYRSAVSEDKPNFVWIVSEDNSKHYMELFDPHGIATPHLEEMASEGILFSRAFSNAPVCSVARSTLISSCYAPRTGTQFHRKSMLVPMPSGVEMFPVYLREAGYYTSNNSKEDYNYYKSDGVWDESSGKAHWTRRAPGQPFFHMESHPVSHESRLHFPAELMDTYQPVTHPDSVHLFPNHPDTELFRFTAAYYRDKILSVDSIVGSVLAELEEQGLLESTFVFYFADHGGVLPGSKGYCYESGLHVPLVVRIPKKFRHLVDFSPGSISDGFVSFVDFGPTLLELAGAGIPDGIDGKPFLGPGIPSGELDRWDVTFGYADRFDEKYDMVRTLRKGKLKYMRSYQSFNVDGLQNNYRYKCLAFQEWRELYAAGELNQVRGAFFEPRSPEALYDLEKDPYETTNLAGKPAYREQLLEMREELQVWVKGMPDLSFFPESVLRQKAFETDPAAFGEEHKARFAELVDVADLSLLPFSQAEAGIAETLASGDPAKMYWALIVCSCFGSEADAFVETARELYTHKDLLVRTRAAEFVGISGKGDPVPVIIGALRESEDGVEALLILNSLVLMVDGIPGYAFDPDLLELAPGVLEYDGVKRRMEYLQNRLLLAKNP